MSIAVYAGTFDPVTYGHLSVIKKAAGIFSHVRVLVAVNPNKNPMFNALQRKSYILDLVDRMPQVTVDITEEYVVEYARAIGARFLVRGIRSATDAEFETMLAHENRKLAPEIDTVLLPADIGLTDVSSSELKRMIGLNKDVSKICSDHVKDAVLCHYRETPR